MKGNGRRQIISIISSLLLLISVTHCWILSNGTKAGKAINVDFQGAQSADGGILRVASEELTVQLLYKNSAGEYVVYDGSSSGFSLDNMVPNDMLQFRIRFMNRSGSSQNVSLTIVGITTDVEDSDGSNPFLEMMYIGMSGGEGYKNATDVNVEVPDDIFISMSDAVKRDTGSIYDLRLYNSVIIPPTAEDEYVELDGFFWFHRGAEIELSGKHINIECFRIIS